MSSDGSIKSGNIERSINTAQSNDVLKAGEAKNIATRMLGTTPPTGITYDDLAKVVTETANTDVPFFSRIVDLMSRDNSKDDEFFTPAGLKALRKAISDIKPPITKDTLNVAITEVLKDKANTSIYVKDLPTETGAVVNASSSDEWEKHLKGMLNVSSDPVFEASLRVDLDLEPAVKLKVATNLNKGGGTKEDYIKTDAYRVREGLMALYSNTTILNGVFRGADTSDPKLIAMCKGVDDLSIALESGDKTKIKEASDSLKAGMANLPGSEKYCFSANYLKDGKNFSPRLLLAMRKDIINRKEFSGAEWMVQTIAVNGESNRAGHNDDGIVDGGFSVDVFEANFKSFVEMVSKGGEYQEFKFYSSGEIAKTQNIMIGKAKDFFEKDHTKLRDYYLALHPDLAGNYEALMNKYIDDLRKADVVEIEDLHDSWWNNGVVKLLTKCLPFGNPEIDKKANTFEAVLDHAARQLENKSELNGEKKDIFTKEFATEALAFKSKMDITEKKDIAAPITADTVKGNLDYAAFFDETKNPDIAEAKSKLGLSPEAKPQEITERLMKEYYGADKVRDKKVIDTSNPRKRRTGFESQKDVGDRVKAGVKFLASDKFPKADASEVKAENLTQKQLDALRKAMSMEKAEDASAPVVP